MEETTITKNILLWEGVLNLKGQYTEEATITKNIYIKKIYLLINFGIENPPLLID